MSVDPNIDYTSHDPEDKDSPSDDPRIREVQELEKKMRAALATKENPLRDDETTSDRLKQAGFDKPADVESAESGSGEDGEDPRGEDREDRATGED